MNGEQVRTDKRGIMSFSGNVMKRRKKSTDNKEVRVGEPLAD